MMTTYISKFNQQILDKKGKDISIYEGDEVLLTKFQGEEMYVSNKGAYFEKNLENNPDKWEKKKFKNK